MSLRAVVVMDYQSVHLTAHDVFDPDGERHDALIHPVRFARTAIRRRNECQRAGYPEAVLRGGHHLPRASAHRLQLGAAPPLHGSGRPVAPGRRHVELRDLRYSFRMTAEGSPATDVYGRKIPEGPGREKGIDRSGSPDLPASCFGT